MATVQGLSFSPLPTRCPNAAKSRRAVRASAAASSPMPFGGSHLGLKSFRTAQEWRRSVTIVAAKASPSGSTQDPSALASDVLKSAQEAWNKVDDKLAIGGLGFSGLILLWASTGLIGAIDKLPVIPDFFEFVGILFSGWFVYRYLLFKPDREELLKVVDETKRKVTGQ